MIDNSNIQYWKSNLNRFVLPTNNEVNHDKELKQ